MVATDLYTSIFKVLLHVNEYNYDKFSFQWADSMLVTLEWSEKILAL